MTRGPEHPGVPETRQEDLRRQLAEYAQTWRDDDFLDAMCDWAQAGRRFTFPQATAIQESLGYWKRRLRGPSLDPGRPPPGYDPLIWDLATGFRRRMEEQGLWCPSRREIHGELQRAIDRDNLRGNHEPWRDRDGSPGWHRMMAAVIAAHIQWHVSPDYPASAARDLAQPGTVTAIAREITEDMMLASFAGHARPARPYVPPPGRRAAVRAYLARRNQR